MAMFVRTSKDSPFARPLPRFPVQRVPLHSASTFAALGRESGMSHVPEWLPAFPEPHTYVRTELWSDGVAKAGGDELEPARQRRKAEKSLLSLQRRLALAGGDGFRPAMLVDGAVKANELDVVQSDANPFLERALPYGEKVVSEVAMPGVGKSFSVIEAFAPAFEESKDGELDEGMDQDQNQSQKRVVPRERPPVYFRIGIDKKSMVMALNSRALSDQKDLWFLKEEKEQRAELILREAMENPHELAQL
uniref:Transcription initiation factor TFIID subunit 8 n=2 Tax=Oryza brachyantha TaxID=4533 RepID=J3LQP0_ORYBR